MKVLCRHSSEVSRSVFGLALCATLFALCSFAEAQQPAKIPWVGYLAGSGSSPNQAFVQGMRDLGYIEGKNIAFVYRTTEGKRRAMPISSPNWSV
jgi:hypothetical protein